MRNQELTESNMSEQQDNGAQQTNITGNRQNEQSNNNRNFNSSNSDVKFFKGSTADIGAVLSLPIERVKLDKGFEFFQTEMETYILKNLENAADVTPVIKKLKDPTSDFASKSIPK